MILWNKTKFSNLLSATFGSSNVITDYNDFTILLKTINDYDVLVVLCELQWNVNGVLTSLQQLEGIEFVKKFRREGVNVPIVFTSFLSRKQVYANKLERGIVNAIGHAFVQLPCKPEDWQKAVEGMEPLSKLEMYDVVHNYCSSAGAIRMLLHSLRGYAGDDLKDKIIEAIQQAYSVFGQNASIALADFDNRFTQVTATNKLAALNCADEIGDRLIEDYAPLEASNSLVKAEGRWKILLLDDEIDENHELVKSLKSRDVIDVICARTAKEAEQAIEKDYHDEKRIVLVVSDYRLEDDENGIKVHQPKQGYRFIAEQASKMPHLRFVALSALPRKFLMQSFLHYGVRVDVFSKKDYLENPATLHLLCDEIVELCNENAKAIARLPGITTEGWDYFVPFYFAHRNSAKYKDNERGISGLAKEYCEGVKEGKFPFQLEGYTVLLKGKKKVPSDAKAFDEFISKMICRRVAIWYSQFNKSATIQDVHRVIKGREYTGTETLVAAKNQINTTLALSLTDFPRNMTIEEKYWIVYEMGFGEVEETERKETEALEFISAALDKWLEEEGINDDIKSKDAFIRFFSNGQPQYGANIRLLKNFLHTLFHHIQNDSNAIQSLQKLIISWQDALKKFSVGSGNLAQLANYIERLRKLLLYSKPLDKKAKVKIENKDVFAKEIIAEAIKNILEYEQVLFDHYARGFFLDDDIDKSSLTTKNDWVKALLAFYREQMDLLKKEGIDFDELKPKRKNKNKPEDDFGDNLDDASTGENDGFKDEEEDLY